MKCVGSLIIILKLFSSKTGYLFLIIIAISLLENFLAILLVNYSNIKFPNFSDIQTIICRLECPDSLFSLYHFLQFLI